jgi:hypothetical protein
MQLAARMKHMALLLVSSSLLFAGACSDDDDGGSGDITREEYDDLARSVGSSTASGGGDAGAMADVVVIASGDLPFGFTVDLDGHVTGDIGGLSYDFSLTCRDLTDLILPECDATTDRADVELAWSGQLDLPNFSSSVTREGSWSVIDLQSDVATFNGDGSFAYHATITAPETQSTVDYALDYAAAYDDVLIETDSLVAVGGTIHYDIAAEKQVDVETTRSFSVSADVTIHADGTATLLLDGTYEYTLDLATGAVARASI